MISINIIAIPILNSKHFILFALRMKNIYLLRIVYKLNENYKSFQILREENRYLKLTIDQVPKDEKLIWICRTLIFMKLKNSLVRLIKIISEFYSTEFGHPAWVIGGGAYTVLFDSLYYGAPPFRQTTDFDLHVKSKIFENIFDEKDKNNSENFNTNNNVTKKKII